SDSDLGKRRADVRFHLESGPDLPQPACLIGATSGPAPSVKRWDYFGSLALHRPSMRSWSSATFLNGLLSRVRLGARRPASKVRYGPILLKDSASRFCSQHSVAAEFAGASIIQFSGPDRSLLRRNRPKPLIGEIFQHNRS